MLHYSHELAVRYGEVSYNRRPYLPTKLSQPPNSLQLTRLACGKLEGVLPAELRENESTVARAAGSVEWLTELDSIAFLISGSKVGDSP